MSAVANFTKNSREEIRVSLDAFQGRTLCNIRVWFQDGDTSRPGKQGIAVNPALLPDLISALQEAQRLAARGGA